MRERREEPGRHGRPPVMGEAGASGGPREGRRAVAAHRYDLVIVGAGSGNTLPADQFAGWRIAVVEADRFGGTCLNRGCVPSKMLVYTADVAMQVRRASQFGLGATLEAVDWPAIRERII